MDKNLVKKCEEVHYDMLRGMYYSGESDLGDVKVVWSDGINDPVWNYGTRVRTIAPQSLIKKVSDFLGEKNRNPSFYLTPTCEPSNLGRALELEGFTIAFTDAWMFFEGQPKVSIPKGIKIKTVENLSEMRLFKDVYDAAYSSGNGPYSFPPEYGKAVLNSFQNQMDTVTAIHQIAFDGTTPIGILSLLSKEDLFGIYNVGTLPDLEGKGIGSMLTLFAVQKALDNGASEVFLQTEADSTNEAFYKKRGFKTRFFAKCYIKK